MKITRTFAISAALAAMLAAGAYYFFGSGEPLMPGSPLAGDAGVSLADKKGCTACHTLDGRAGIGPTWLGVYGTHRILSDDSRVLADETYIRTSIRDPAAEVVKGFDNIMLAPELSDAELGQLLQLIRELGASQVE